MRGRDGEKEQNIKSIKTIVREHNNEIEYIHMYVYLYTTIAVMTTVFEFFVSADDGSQCLSYRTVCMYVWISVHLFTLVL